MHAGMDAAERTAGVASCSYDVGRQHVRAGRRAACRRRQQVQTTPLQPAIRWQHSAGMLLVMTSASRCDDRPDHPPHPTPALVVGPHAGIASQMLLSAQCSTVEQLQTARPDRDAAIAAALRNCLTESNLPIGAKTVVRVADSMCNPQLCGVLQHHCAGPQRRTSSESCQTSSESLALGHDFAACCCS